MTIALTDKRGRPVVAVTGMGLVTSLGWGKAANWSGLVAGHSGISRITRFPTDGLRTTIAGTIEPADGIPYSAYAHSLGIAEAAAAEAIAEAGIGSARHFPGPLFIATPPSELEWPHLFQLHAASPDPSLSGYRRLLAAARSRQFGDLARHSEFASIADRIQGRFGTRGEPLSLCTACASGASTIQMGLEAIRRGEADAALCIGTDATVHPEGLIRFSLLSALSTRNENPETASRPFSKSRDGFVIAEGAGAVVLESYAHATARGAQLLGVVLGAGEKADRLSSYPIQARWLRHHRGHAARLCTMPICLPRRSITSMHTAPARPRMTRWSIVALRAVMGERIAALPISSNKSSSATR